MTNLGVTVRPAHDHDEAGGVLGGGRKHPAGSGSRCSPHSLAWRPPSVSSLETPRGPLLVSVRSGARASMPGMMAPSSTRSQDRTVLGLARWTKNERFAWDCYRRFITIFGDVVLAIDRHAFDELLDRAKAQAGARPTPICSPSPQGPRGGVQAARPGPHGKAFPQDPIEQLRLAVSAVFDSWFAKKAVDYRRIHRLPDDWGTAVTVMAMVFGNLGGTSGTGGVLHARSVERRASLLRRVLVNARVKTWWRASARRSPSPPSRGACPRSMTSS